MAKARMRTLELAAKPNVVPFIDVLLVLLIVFMVTAPKSTVDLHVNLPHGRSIPSPLRPTVVELRETPAGLALFVDDEPVRADDLPARTFARAVADNPTLPAERIYADARIFVRADQATAYGNVVDVMSQLRLARFAQIGIYAESAEPS